MKKGVFLAFAIVPLLYGQSVCVDTSNLDVSSKGIELIKEYDDLSIPNKYVKRVFNRNTLFAKALLKKYGLSEEDRGYIDLKVAEALANIYMKKESDRFEPNEKEIKSFYIEHMDEFKPILKAELSLISVKSLELADRIYKELQKDTSKFKELAKKYSIDGTSEIGGKLGKVDLDKFPLPVREWVRGHKESEISEPIRIGDYFFVVQLHKKVEKKPTYENVKDEIKNLLKRLVKTKKLKEEYKRLKKEDL